MAQIQTVPDNQPQTQSIHWDSSRPILVVKLLNFHSFSPMCQKSCSRETRAHLLCKLNFCTCCYSGRKFINSWLLLPCPIFIVLLPGYSPYFFLFNIIWMFHSLPLSFMKPSILRTLVWVPFGGTIRPAEMCLQRGVRIKKEEKSEGLSVNTVAAPNLFAQSKRGGQKTSLLWYKEQKSATASLILNTSSDNAFV